MSWGVNLDDLAAARDALAEEVAEHPRSHPLEQLGHAHLWLDEVTEAARCFRAAAADAEAVLRRWGRDDPAGRSRIGSLLRRAGDVEAAAEWFEWAARSEARLDRRALLSYLRGDDASAVALARQAARAEETPYPLMDALAALSTARREGHLPAVEAARSGFAALMRREKTSPDQESGSSDLPLSGWLAETFVVGSAISGEPLPDHRAMLAATGLLRAEPGPPRPQPRPDLGPQGRGTLRLTYPQPGTGTIEPSVTIDDCGDLFFLLHPERGLRVELRQTGDRWRAVVNDLQLPGTYRGPHSALQAAGDVLGRQPDGQWATALLSKLFRESFQI